MENLKKFIKTLTLLDNRVEVDPNDLLNEFFIDESIKIDFVNETLHFFETRETKKLDSGEFEFWISENKTRVLEALEEVFRDIRDEVVDL